MSAGSLADPSVRAGLYKRLGRHNRIIGMLRILVPVFGVLLLGFLVSEIVIANMARSYGLSGIHLDRDRLLVETPRYEGVTENGTHYKVVAKTASALISRTDIIELGDATLEIVRPDGVAFTATAKSARYNLVGQTVEVPDVADVVDSRHTKARLHNSLIDWTTQTITARGGAEITFADGTQLTAHTLVMHGNDNVWDMAGVSLVAPGSEETQ